MKNDKFAIKNGIRFLRAIFNGLAEKEKSSQNQ